MLDAGRLLVADNWYGSIPLAKYLTERNIEYCGTIKSKRKGIPSSVKDAKLKKGEIKAQENTDGIRILKYKDKKDVLILSTFHGSDFKDSILGKDTKVKL